MTSRHKTRIEELNVLVVDDEATIVGMVESVLRDMGVVSVYTAADGVQALDYFAGGVRIIDLIVCDWMMPEMNGLEFVQKARAMHVEAPVIMLTVLNDPKHIVAARDAGVSAYIAKPFTAVQLKEKVGHVAASILKT